MHILFDQRLTNPTEAALASALLEVCAAVNGKRQVGILTILETATKFLTKPIMAQPEGHHDKRGTQSEEDTTRIVVAWWTAAGSRKLVRIRGWREPWREYQADYSNPLRVAMRDHDGRPPVWHLDPERITLAGTGETTQCVAVCGCGAVGSPETLAWAGGMCGACHDKIEKSGPKSVTHDSGLLTTPDFVPDGVAFTNDAKQVIGVGPTEYHVWNRINGDILKSGKCSGPRAAGLRPAVSPDGRFAFLGSNSTGLLAIDLAHASKELAANVVDPEFVIQSAHWTGRPGELLIGTLLTTATTPVGDERALALVTLPDFSIVKSAMPGTSTRLHTIAADAKHPQAVFSDGGNIVVCEIDRKGKLGEQQKFRLGTGQHDRSGNWTSGPDIVRFSADGERVLFVFRNEMELWNPRKPKALVQATFPMRISDCQFSPDGERLYVVSEDGTLFVCHPGLLTHVRVRLRWHVGAVAGLTVSNDGKTLATAGAEGVKLWPIDRLLEVL